MTSLGSSWVDRFWRVDSIPKQSPEEKVSWFGLCHNLDPPYLTFPYAWIGICKCQKKKKLETATSAKMKVPVISNICGLHLLLIKKAGHLYYWMNHSSLFLSNHLSSNWAKVKVALVFLRFTVNINVYPEKVHWRERGWDACSQNRVTCWMRWANSFHLAELQVPRFENIITR